MHGSLLSILQYWPSYVENANVKSIWKVYTSEYLYIVWNLNPIFIYYKESTLHIVFSVYVAVLSSQWMSVPYYLAWAIEYLPGPSRGHRQAGQCLYYSVFQARQNDVNGSSL